MSRAALHTFVHKGRHGIKEQLGLVSVNQLFLVNSLKPNLFLESGLYFFQLLLKLYYNTLVLCNDIVF